MCRFFTKLNLGKIHQNYSLESNWRAGFANFKQEKYKKKRKFEPNDLYNFEGKFGEISQNPRKLEFFTETWESQRFTSRISSSFEQFGVLKSEFVRSVWNF